MFTVAPSVAAIGVMHVQRADGIRMFGWSECGGTKSGEIPYFVFLGCLVCKTFASGRLNVCSCSSEVGTSDDLCSACHSG